LVRRFILQAIHPDYACPAFNAMFATDRPDDLRALLGPDAADDPEFNKVYWLEDAEIPAICDRFGVAFDAGGREVVLFEFRPTATIPYLVHTNFELVLLLEGRKKLARMYHEYPPDRHHHEDRFDHYVAQGLLHKEVDIEKFAKPFRAVNGHLYDGVRTAYYTPKGEEWRIPAWRLIEKAREKGGWNDTLERLEGMLYGYEDWQNDWWAAHRRKMRKGAA
jgi:hypothetical protein